VFSPVVRRVPAVVCVATSYQGITKGKLTLGYKNYELSNHLGNVLTTIADNKFFAAPPSGTGLSLFARVATSQDYYPFGMAMTERSFKENTDKKYRFGFNGKEYENDISEGVYNFEARMMDSRICRFTSTDPLAAKYANISPFVFVANMPLIDTDGKEFIFFMKAGTKIEMENYKTRIEAVITSCLDGQYKAVLVETSSGGFKLSYEPI
jgi:RHS repeat-associated protein